MASNSVFYASELTTTYVEGPFHYPLRIEEIESKLGHPLGPTWRITGEIYDASSKCWMTMSYFEMTRRLQPNVDRVRVDMFHFIAEDPRDWHQATPKEMLGNVDRAKAIVLRVCPTCGGPKNSYHQIKCDWCGSLL